MPFLSRHPIGGLSGPIMAHRGGDTAGPVATRRPLRTMGEMVVEAWVQCIPAGYVIEERHLLPALPLVISRTLEEVPGAQPEDLSGLFTVQRAGQVPIVSHMLRPKAGLVHFLHFWKAFGGVASLAGAAPAEGLDAELETVRDAILRRVDEEAAAWASDDGEAPPGLLFEVVIEELHRAAAMSGRPRFWGSVVVQLIRRPRRTLRITVEELSGLFLGWIEEVAIWTRSDADGETVLRGPGGGLAGVLVLLHVYDVSRSEQIQKLNRFLAHEYSPVKFGGVFHTGVEVHGLEWSFNFTPSRSRSGISCIAPRKHPHHRYRETVDCGCTLVPFAEINMIVSQLLEEYPGKSYDILRRNCCHFADDFLQRLGLGGVPGWVHRLARLGSHVENAMRAVQSLKDAVTVGCGSGTCGATDVAVERRLSRSRRATVPENHFEVIGLETCRDMGVFGSVGFGPEVGGC